MRQRPIRRLVQTLMCGMLMLAAGSAAGETYLVPIVAQGLEGSDGAWTARATVTNPNAFPVTLTVARVFPLRTEPCDACPVQGPPVTIAPAESITLQAGSGLQRQRLVAGAVEVETSGPVNIHLVAYRAGAREIRQRLDVARAWLRPGVQAVSTVERGGGSWRMNVFVVNPGEAPLAVSVWAADRAENEVRAVVPPRATGVIGLPPPLCNGVPCPVSGVHPPPPLSVFIEAGGEFLAGVSSLGADWAVFSLADEAFLVH